MKRLYLSTDSSEAQRVIQRNGNLKPNFCDIDMTTGSYLVERVGFNPMSLVEFPDSVSDRHIKNYIILFGREGIFTTLLNVEGKYVQNKPHELLYEAVAQGYIRPNSRPNPRSKQL